MIKILIAHSISVVRHGLCQIIHADNKLQLVGETANGYKLQTICSQQIWPDVFLIDSALPGPSFDCLIDNLLMINQKSNILVITHSMETLELQNLVRRGISGCILQNESEIQISQAVRSVGLGGLWFSKAFLEKLVPNIAEKGLFEVDDTYDLTTREWEVAKLIADGLSNREIALSLKIKERTVEFHVTNILQKLNVNSRVTVAIWISNIIRTYPENRQVKN